MSSATFESFDEDRQRDRHPAALPIGVILSLAFHLAIALLLMFSPWAKHEMPPPEFVMEVVQLPKPPEPRAPEPPPAPTQPEVQPNLPRPEVPQLVEAPITDKSSPPPQASKTPAPPHERPTTSRAEPKSAAAPALQAPANSADANATPATLGRHDRKAEPQGGGPPEPASQRVQDFILMQIARAWIIDLHSPRFRDLDISWVFVLRPDGMLEAPFGKNDPWDLSEMVDPRTYAIMKEASDRGQFYTTVVTTFLQAVRQAQPFRVPPKEESYVNRALPLRFHAGDLVQTTSENTGAH
ncbi:MAG TPA: hypothetical protein VGB82_20090 [Alphaproteobacteria bacterium]